MVLISTIYNSKATRISESARDNINSTRWSYDNSWNGDSRYVNTWKCNLFVYDMLQEVNAVTPTRW